MRPRIVALIVALAVAAVAVAAKGSPGPLDLYTQQRYVIVGVETQPWELNVQNTTPCLWTTDDHWDVWGSGYLDAGASSSIGDCVIADTATQVMYFEVNAPTSGLVARVCFAPQGACMESVGSAVVGNRSVARLCVAGPHYPDYGPPLAEIPNTNGGIGLRTDLTVTVSNATAKRIRDVQAQFRWSPGGISSPCTGAVLAAGPFSWQTS